MDPYRAAGITRGTALYHGGAPGRQVGDLLLSAAELAASGKAVPGRRPGETEYCRHVYAFTDRDLARAFATRTEAFLGAGCVYRVEPVPASSLAVDPDFPKVGLTCRRARVVEVVEVDVTMPYQEVTRLFAPHLEWDDGTPVYREDGYMNPSPQWDGVTESQLRAIGQWVPVDAVLFNPMQRRFLVRDEYLR